LVARFMGDNNIISGRVAESSNGRVVVENDEDVRITVSVNSASAPAVGDAAQVAIRAAAVQLDDAGAAVGNSIETEIVFVEFLGDLVKLHLTAGGERMLAKVPGERYPDLRGREGEKIRISWKEEDVQLLQS